MLKTIMFTRMKSLTSRMAVMFLSALAVLWPATALAQSPPPQPDLRNSLQPWVGMLIMFVMVAVVMAVSLIPSKRTHQD